MPVAQPSPRRAAGRAALAAALAAVVALGALAAASSPGSAVRRGSGAASLRLGYFPNVTHATALVGVESGLLRQALGDTKLETFTFNAGPQASEALLSGAVDATYVGPNPAINAFTQSGGAIHIVAGAASGGAFLVVKPEIEKAADLRGTVLASPQLGGTQDVALRTWLKKRGLKTDTTGGGDVSIRPQENAQTLELFKSGGIDGAWVPEPWATRLVQEGGGHVLVDEATLWPGGRYVTTHLMVRTDYLTEHPGVVRRLLRGHVAANDLIAERPARARALVAQGIERVTAKPIDPSLVEAAFDQIEFTNDPIATSLRKSAKDATAVGLLDEVDLKGIYDLRLLNQVLRAKGRPVIATSRSKS